MAPQFTHILTPVKLTNAYTKGLATDFFFLLLAFSCFVSEMSTIVPKLWLAKVDEVYRLANLLLVARLVKVL